MAQPDALELRNFAESLGAIVRDEMDVPVQTIVDEQPAVPEIIFDTTAFTRPQETVTFATPERKQKGLLHKAKMVGATALASVLGVVGLSAMAHNRQATEASVVPRSPDTGVTIPELSGTDETVKQIILAGMQEDDPSWQAGDITLLDPDLYTDGSQIPGHVEDRGDGAFSQGAYSRADLMEWLNSDDPKAVKARECLREGKSLAEVEDALTGGEDYFLVSMNTPATYHGNGVLSNGKLSFTGPRKVQANDVFWAHVDVDNGKIVGEFDGEMSVRGDCTNCRVTVTKEVPPGDIPPVLKTAVPLPQRPGGAPADTDPGSGGSPHPVPPVNPDPHGYNPGQPNPNPPAEQPPIEKDPPINPPENPSDGTVQPPAAG